MNYHGPRVCVFVRVLKWLVDVSCSFLPEPNQTTAVTGRLSFEVRLGCVIGLLTNAAPLSLLHMQTRTRAHTCREASSLTHMFMLCFPYL